MINNTLNLSY